MWKYDRATDHVFLTDAFLLPVVKTLHNKRQMGDGEAYLIVVDKSEIKYSSSECGSLTSRLTYSLSIALNNIPACRP